MSFDKVEVRVFSGPDQVQVGSNTEPDLIVMNIGPKGDTGATGNTGATGPAGPNSVTSATTSDGTANLSLGDLEVVGGEIYTDGEYSSIYTQGATAHIFTLGSGAEIFTEGELAQIYTTGASAQIYTAGAGATIGTQGANATIYTTGAYATISTAGSAAHIQTSHASAAVKSTNFAAVESGGASLVDGSMQPCLTWSAGGRNLTIPSGTATTFNATSYTYGSGAAAAHRTALGLTTLATTTPAANVANFLTSPTSDNLASALTDENGTGGGFVRAEGATLTSPALVGPVNLTSQDSSTADRVMNRGLIDSRTIISKLDTNFTVNNNASYNATSMVLSLTPGWWEINGEFRIDSAVGAAGAKLYLAFTGSLPEAYSHRLWIASVSSGATNPSLLYPNPAYGSGTQPFLMSQAIASTAAGTFKVGPSLIYLTADATITVGMSQNVANVSNTTMLAFPFSRIWATRLQH